MFAPPSVSAAPDFAPTSPDFASASPDSVSATPDTSSASPDSVSALILGSRLVLGAFARRRRALAAVCCLLCLGSLLCCVELSNRLPLKAAAPVARRASIGGLRGVKRSLITLRCCRRSGG